LSAEEGAPASGAAEQSAAVHLATLRGALGIIGLVLAVVALLGPAAANQIADSALDSGHGSAALRLDAGIDLALAAVALFVAGWAWHLSTSSAAPTDNRAVISWAALPVAAIATALNLIAFLASLAANTNGFVRFAG
jgi:hypothetical protein